LYQVFLPCAAWKRARKFLTVRLIDLRYKPILYFCISVILILSVYFLFRKNFTCCACANTFSQRAQC